MLILEQNVRDIYLICCIKILFICGNIKYSIIDTVINGLLRGYLGVIKGLFSGYLAVIKGLFRGY